MCTHTYPTDDKSWHIEWGVIRSKLNSAISETLGPQSIHALTLGVCLCAWSFLCVHLLLNVLQHSCVRFSLLGHCVLYSIRSLTHGVSDSLVTVGMNGPPCSRAYSPLFNC